VCVCVCLCVCVCVRVSNRCVTLTHGRGTQVYGTIMSQLLPTPTKPHYTFNLRDLGKVFQGMLMAELRAINNVPTILRLWVHECRRVFMDRLVNDEDRAWFDSQVRVSLAHTHAHTHAHARTTHHARARIA
jgi:AAA+ lid domain